MLRTVSDESTVAVNAVTGHVVFDKSAMNPALLKKYQDFEKEFDKKERFVERKTKLLRRLRSS